ncbi:Cytochrome b5-like heme/steroid binding domain [Pseudocohnilembus persalinus]|uniref:Cytochrome b5-like heme/steroid binding domain n=1 Tax=Pseudocohnilembus persalinus TaxID=266149 RepID=A0A0V0R7F3_PSEPJ|nr:Cytochrome b5-like heme/steroid binding domain [Pseudocohnilembus persalinus]|eukprot:KRX10395.1 Cytochrome b5-like heme/steroid binding domain [Pseudocohnilembus persalinus]
MTQQKPEQNQQQQQNPPSQNQYTWQEIQKHHTYQDCWLVIDNIVYDVTEWAPKHPGGDIIYLAGGTEATVMASTYHPAGINPKLLQKYQIGTVKSNKENPQEDVSFYDDLNKDEFYNTLKQRVQQYFDQNKITRRGEGVPLMYLKSIIILASFFVSLYYMTLYGSFIAAFFMGVAAAEIGINVMHDGSHGAFSKFNILNTISCWTMDMIGASSYVWESQHVGGHHLYTNLDHDREQNPEQDPDVFSSYPFMRMHPNCERKWFHQYQHIYGPILFMTFTMVKVLYNDFACFYYKKVMHISMNQRLSQKKNIIRVVISKIASLIYMLFLPMIFNGFAKGFSLFATAHFTCGFILAFMFIVTHVSEGCNFLGYGQDIKELDLQQKSIQDAKKKFQIQSTKKASEKSWAALQCKTSVNWSLNSVFWTNFSGGLNHQIEHHLFPGICHMHYPKLQPIVEKTCAEFQVPYMKYQTIYQAVGGMLNVLKIFGNPPSQEKKNQ